MTDLHQNASSKTLSIPTPKKEKIVIAINKIKALIKENKIDLNKLNNARKEINKLFNDDIPEEIMYLMNDSGHELIEKYSKCVFNHNTDKEFIILDRMFNFCELCAEKCKTCTHRMFFATGDKILCNFVTSLVNNIKFIENDPIFKLFKTKHFLTKYKTLFDLTNITNKDVLFKFVIYLMLQLKILTVKHQMTDIYIDFKALISNDYYEPDYELTEIERYILKLLNLSNIMKSKNSAQLCTYLTGIINIIIFNMLNLYFSSSNKNLTYDAIYRLIDLLPNSDDILNVKIVNISFDDNLTEKIIISDESFNKHVFISTDDDDNDNKNPILRTLNQVIKCQQSLNYIITNNDNIVDLRPIRLQTYFCIHKGVYNNSIVNCEYLSLFKILYILGFYTNNSHIMRIFGLYLQQLINSLTQLSNITVESVKLSITDGELFIMKCNSYKVNKDIETIIIGKFKEILISYNSKSDSNRMYSYCTGCINNKL